MLTYTYVLLLCRLENATTKQTNPILNPHWAKKKSFLLKCVFVRVIFGFNRKRNETKISINRERNENLSQSKTKRKSQSAQNETKIWQTTNQNQTTGTGHKHRHSHPPNKTMSWPLQVSARAQVGVVVACVAAYVLYVFVQLIRSLWSPRRTYPRVKKVFRKIWHKRVRHSAAKFYSYAHHTHWRTHVYISIANRVVCMSYNSIFFVLKLNVNFFFYKSQMTAIVAGKQVQQPATVRQHESQKRSTTLILPAHCCSHDSCVCRY